MAVQEYLPGSPTKRLVKLVRMILRKYGIKPRGPQWCATWFEEFSAQARSPYPERSRTRCSFLVAGERSISARRCPFPDALDTITAETSDD